MLDMEKEAKSLSGKFRIRALNAGTAVEVTRGTLTMLCVTHQGGTMKAAVISQEMTGKIEAGPAG